MQISQLKKIILLTSKSKYYGDPMNDFIIYWLNSLISPVQVFCYLLLGIAVYESYKKNKKFVFTKFIKIIIVIILILWALPLFDLIW